MQVCPAREPYQPSSSYAQPGNKTPTIFHLPGIPSQGPIQTLFYVCTAREPLKPSSRYAHCTAREPYKSSSRYAHCTAREPYKPSSRYAQPANHIAHLSGILSHVTIPTIFSYCQPVEHPNSFSVFSDRGHCQTSLEIPSQETYK
jgi:hypothetical protein